MERRGQGTSLVFLDFHHERNAFIGLYKVSKEFEGKVPPTASS